MGDRELNSRKCHTSFSYSSSKLVLKLKDDEWVVIYLPEVSGVSLTLDKRWEFPINVFL